jgi:hypothetical protein
VSDIPENLASELIDKIVGQLGDPQEIPPYSFEDMLTAIKSIPKDNRVIKGDEEARAAFSSMVKGHHGVEDDGTPLVSYCGIRVETSNLLPPGTMAFTDGEKVIVWGMNLDG